MRLSVALKYLRRTRAGIGYRRDFPAGLRAVLGRSTFTQPLGRTEADAARNWQMAHKAYGKLVQDAARKAVSQASPGATASPLEKHREIGRYLRSLGLGRDAPIVYHGDAVALEEAEGREAVAEAILDKYRNHSGPDEFRPLSPEDERRVRALNSGMGSSPSPKLSDAVALYFKERPQQAEHKERQRINRAVRRLEALLGPDPAITGISREDARGFRDSLFAGGLAPGSVNRELVIIKAIFNMAKMEFELPNWANPFNGVSQQDDDAEVDKRLPLKQDIRAAVLRRLETRCREVDFSRIWRLLDGTGCRLAEITGVRVGDMKLEAALPHIDLVEIPERGLKTTSARRLVPLVGDALVAAKEAVEASGDGVFLFKRYARKGGPTAASKSLMNHLRTVSGDKRHVVHSLRHTMADRLEEAEVPQDVRNGILGHMQTGTGAITYGSRETRLRVTTAAMRKAFGLAGGDSP
tara:strand:- start:9222 stop:10622 length:1401 start_codon:yes stop_codon:yes gene_type:complete